jgi:tRNA modification GTPase
MNPHSPGPDTRSVSHEPEFADGDPIVALATAAGRGAIAVVRVSGRGCARLLAAVTGRAAFTPRLATRVSIRLGDDLTDEGLALWFPGPHSYTGEDSFELSLHGGPLLATRAVQVLAALGARPARAGEFTLRAFLNGKMDLVQAEAVADLVDAVTPAQARVAAAHLRGALSASLSDLAGDLVELLERLEASLDFPDEGLHFVEAAEVIARLAAADARCEELLSSGTRGRVLRQGATAVLAGRPNVGKSSLFNALIGHARAIVTEVPGTTRDVLRETVELGGVPVELVDAAGWRDTDEEVERQGVARARAMAADADVVIVVVDGAAGPDEDDERVWRAAAQQERWLVVNKGDAMTRPWTAPWVDGGRRLVVSARTGDGIDRLRDDLAAHVGRAAWEPETVTRARHLHLLGETRSAVARALQAAREGASEEFVAADVREALATLEEIRGRVTADTLLDGIFSRFCIGK